MSANTDEPAFPFACQGPTTAPEIYYGMTLRDYFAARASEVDIEEHIWKGFKEDVPILCSDGSTRMGSRNAHWTREQAKYRYADAMLKAREEK